MSGYTTYGECSGVRVQIRSGTVLREIDQTVTIGPVEEETLLDRFEDEL